MRICVIAALDRNGLIGDERGLPWRLPRDLRRFRDLTLGKPVIMGRTTREHIGRPLDGRHNIVLSRTAGRVVPGCTVVDSFEAGLRAAGPNAEEVFVIGGAAVYRAAMPRADRFHLTLVEGQFRGTTYFPIELVRPNEWVVTERQLCEADTKNAYRHLYLALERARPGQALVAEFDLAATLLAPLAATK